MVAQQEMTQEDRTSTAQSDSLRALFARSSNHSLKLETWPSFFVLPTHLSPEDVHDVKEQLQSTGATVTVNIVEAQIILTAISSFRRVKFELQTRKLKILANQASTLGKRKRDSDAKSAQLSNSPSSSLTKSPSNKGIVEVRDDLSLYIAPGHLVVLQLTWLTESFLHNRIENIDAFTVLEGKIVDGSPDALEELTADNSSSVTQAHPTAHHNHHQNPDLSLSTSPVQHSSSLRRSTGSSVPPNLVRETTSEYEERSANPLPEQPKWVQEGIIYACQRSTPPNSANEKFISLLKKIRLARILRMDEIGVRAYSTSIASVAAYPYPLTSPTELLNLPGCEHKISILFQEFQSSGQILEAKAVDDDEYLQVLNKFYSIWGVGAKTAKEFYNRGWRDSDDIVEHGWDSLTRVQQIGLKYADEFEKKIPRSEVEFIASVVTYYAKQIVDESITCTTVGGYRRGKSESGDVDIILSHPNTDRTHYLIKRLVRALEIGKWITHTLTISEANSDRDQETLPVKSNAARSSGFDTLDKALVVWQDPSWPNREKHLAKDPDSKNPNIHRRVDIIIAPWRTVGCAIAGWTSGTTFQRDLRRYAKKVKGWKFDSSGVRDRSTGRWIDLEKYNDKAQRAKTPLEAEMRVFEGLGLKWRPPEERCTD